MIIAGKSIRRASSVLLTKDEVLEFMQHCPVYRYFSNENIPPIKVTGENLSILHQAVYNPNAIPVEEASEKTVTEEPRKNIIHVEEINTTPAPVVQTPTETVIPKNMTEEESESTSDASEDEQHVEESEEEETTEESTEEVVEDEKVETIDVKDEAAVEDKVASAQSNQTQPNHNQNNYYNKNNNYKKKH
jgi:hypothetical protein